MNSICHRLLIKAALEKVYDALSTQEGLAGWWTPDTQAKPERGSRARFRFGADYFKEMRVVNLDPGKKVEWICEKGYEDWIGTKVRFALEEEDGGTVLTLTHDGWQEYTPGVASCSYDWAMFLRSLRLLCETGKGRPYPDFQ